MITAEVFEHGRSPAFHPRVIGTIIEVHAQGDT